MKNVGHDNLVEQFGVDRLTDQVPLLKTYATGPIENEPRKDLERVITVTVGVIGLLSLAVNR